MTTPKGCNAHRGEYQTWCASCRATSADDRPPTRWAKVDRGGSSLDYMAVLPAPIVGDHETATHVLRWYNRQERSWVVSYATAEGRQVGSSTYVHSESEALAVAEHLIAEAVR